MYWSDKWICRGSLRNGIEFQTTEQAFMEIVEDIKLNLQIAAHFTFNDKDSNDWGMKLTQQGKEFLESEVEKHEVALRLRKFEARLDDLEFLVDTLLGYSCEDLLSHKPDLDWSKVIPDPQAFQAKRNKREW